MLGLGLDLAYGGVLKFGISLVLEVDRGGDVSCSPLALYTILMDQVERK